MSVDVRREFEGLRLGDRRLEARADAIVTALSADPSLSFPKVYRHGEAALEAHYRFTNNAAVEPEELLRPHRERSWERAAASGALVLAIHDTTEASFPGEGGRRGLVAKSRRSVIHLHVSLLAGFVAAPVVYGVVGVRAYLLENEVWREVGANDELTPLACGSERWRDAMASTHAACPPGRQLVHVMDREADDFALWRDIVSLGDDFVIRSAQNRATTKDVLLEEALHGTPYLFKRQVKVSRRSAHRPLADRTRHPAREERTAELSARAGTIEIRKPSKGRKSEYPPFLELRVVEVTELEPPEGEEPVSWRLVTTLPVDTPEDVERIIDIYRKRWLIEEFFKALKTGCSLEERQAEGRHAILNTLSLLVPMAVRLLQVRAMGRFEPDAACDLLDEVELLALKHLVPAAKLPERPTNRQVMLAVARLGGHLRANGDPGWQTLGAGQAYLDTFTTGWRAAWAAAGPARAED